MKNRLFLTISFLWCAIAVPVNAQTLQGSSSQSATKFQSQDVLTWPIQRIDAIKTTNLYRAWKASRQQRFSEVDAVLTLVLHDGVWSVEQSGILNAVSTDTSTEQILICESCGSGTIYITASVFNPVPSSGLSTCNRGLVDLDHKQARNQSGYTECNSAFFSCQTSALQATLGWSMALTGSRLCTPEINRDAVAKALKDAKVNDWYRADLYAQYRKRYENIKTAISADLFAERFSQNDPDNLVATIPQLKARIVEEENSRMEKETADTESRRKAATEQREREIAIASARRELDIAKATKRDEIRSIRTKEFRAKIGIGSETFCGPVISIRGPMIQIAMTAQLPGFSSEQWLKIEDAFPATVASCQNHNGKPIPIWIL